MTFDQADAELAEIAGGEYRTIRYERTHYSNKDYPAKVECHVYIHGHSHTNGETWREALDAMRERINPTPRADADPLEAPDETKAPA